MKGLYLIKTFLVKLIQMFKFLLICYRNGGVTYAKIVQLNKGETLKNKRVLITGGASGIGFSIAKKSLSEGAKVVIAGRDFEKLEAAKVKLNSSNLSILKWDVSDLSQINSKLEETCCLLNGAVNVLVNNAGVLLDQNFFTVAEEVWDKTYAVNSKAVYFLSQAVSNLLIKQNLSGKIVNISSTSGFYGTAIPYGMTKWDVAGLTEGLGKKLAPYGIIVNGIAPGRTATSMLKKEQNDNIFDSKTSARRFGLPEEIAELSVFLMSDATNFIVGQTIVCDGGYILKV